MQGCIRGRSVAIFGAPETLCRYRYTLERDDFGEEVLGRSTLAGGYAFLLEGTIFQY